MVKIIGLGEMATSNVRGDVLKTYALASCVGVTVYSKVRRVAGMAHIVLPKPYRDAEAHEKPAYYATTGVPLLINSICEEYGCHVWELSINVYGGAHSERLGDVFRVGERNLAEIQIQLTNMNLTYKATDIGGRCSRTIEMDVSSGDVKVTKQPLN